MYIHVLPLDNYLDYIETKVGNRRQGPASNMGFCIHVQILKPDFNGGDFDPNSRNRTSNTKIRWSCPKLKVWFDIYEKQDAKANLSMRFLSLRRNFSLSSSATPTSLFTNLFFSWNPRLPISTSWCSPNSLSMIPFLTRLYVGSFSRAAHIRASSSSSSREDLENTSSLVLRWLTALYSSESSIAITQ